MKILKCVAVGDGCVGKTCLLQVFSTQEFPTSYSPTVLDNFSVNIVQNKEVINLWVWDTAGQNEYDRLRPLCYPNTDVFLMVYSVTSKVSFQNITARWYPEVYHYCPEVPVILCATKIDSRDTLPEDSVISRDKGKALATKMGAYYVECSALAGLGVQEVFDEVVRVAIATNGGTETRIRRRRGKKCSLL